MASDTKKIVALGRPFTLGMLYDARADKLIPGLRLWDDETLQAKITESNKPFSEFQISSSDTIESKSSMLQVDASLKASFLSGLVEVGGSAKYLNDSKKFKNQSRVTCQYKATTNFKELSVIDLKEMNTQQVDMIEKSSATHVVTGILYGANAFFVFDSEKLEDSSVRDIQVKIEAVIRMMPVFSVESRVETKLTEEQKSLTNKFSCKFYGDFILESNPATFTDAVKTCAELPKLLGGNGDNSVPLEVWLMPLNFFHSKTAELVSGISVGLVRKAQDALQELREIRMRCNDSLDDKVVQNFPQIQAELTRFQQLCEYYEANLKRTMAEKFPLIREGKENESSVNQLLDDRQKSPFSYKNLDKWLDQEEREINIIKSCVDTMDGMKIVKSESELDREVLSPGVEEALCFVFTSMETPDPGLDVMAAFLESREAESTSEDLWYYSGEVITKLRDKAKDVRDLAKGLKGSSQFLFLIGAIDNNKHKGATIYHYRNGILVTDDFSKPEPPPAETITDRRDLIWYYCDLTLDPDTAQGHLTLSEGNKKAKFGKWNSYPGLPERFDSYKQVLCKEGLNGRHYWEVEWGGCVRAGVTYRGIKRKSYDSEVALGYNELSWVLYSHQNTKYGHLHNSKAVPISVSSLGFKRLGVYLNWPAGTLSFYMVDSNLVTHLHTFKTKFREAVYPAFLAGFKDSEPGQIKLI
uniref:neoverrucotoxin subunit beta-like n=1 Tax=Scatophagus argus TaxID=75038 RepID=UPI001ED82793|nr:neoverrucotoxin subunit beta-like [Scatophagus argus]XP_046234235.1 neoverrucotoxin subunit beta-like [Scatophagus argus]